MAEQAALNREVDGFDSLGADKSGCSSGEERPAFNRRDAGSSPATRTS
jgi:hypothetical protein